MMSLLLLILQTFWLLEGTTASQKDYMYVSVGLDDYKFMGNVIFETQAVSFLHCARMCSQYQFCLAFTLDSERTCRGQSIFVTPGTPSTSAPGARTFVRKNAAPPKNCLEVEVRRSGVMTIYNDDHTTLQVFCDQDTEGSGWTVFQRRQDGSVNFYRNWTDYQAGFGDMTGEFWLGLDALHALTSKHLYDLRVDLTTFNGTTGYASYSKFSVGDGAANYVMTYERFIGGNAGDSLSYHRRRPFSTYDADNDPDTRHCARDHHGGWWFFKCAMCNPNGRYFTEDEDDCKSYDAITWYTLTGTPCTMRAIALKMRPRIEP